MPSPDEIQRIATAMNALRPDWRYTSLVTFLTNHHAARPYRDLAIAATAVATDARTTTPNLLNEHGPWWVASQTAAGTAAKSTMAGVPAPGTPRCPRHEHELAACCRACAVEALDPTDIPTLALSPAQVARNTRGARLVRDAIAGAPVHPFTTSARLTPLPATHTPAGPDVQSLAAHDIPEEED